MTDLTLYFNSRQLEAIRLTAQKESKAAAVEAESEALSAGGKEWDAESEAKSDGVK